MSEKNEAVKALVRALPKMPVIRHTQTVNTGRFSYSYAELHEIIKTVVPILAEHGLAVMQRLEAHGGVSGVTTCILHESGDLVESFLPFPLQYEQRIGADGKDSSFALSDPRDYGQLHTYFRRYALSAMLGIATEKDLDMVPNRPKQAPTASRNTGRQQVSTQDINDAGKAVYGGQWSAVAQSICIHYGVSGLSGLTEAQTKVVLNRLRGSDGKANLWDKKHTKEEVAA